MKNIIAAVRNKQEFELALHSKVNIIFLLSSNISSLKENVNNAHECGKKLFIHMDFADGIGKDKYGILYAKEQGIDGIISTRTNIIKIARDAGLLTVQRFFIVDSHSIETSIETAKASKADMIEIMPGTLAKVIERLKKCISVPIVAGGLVETESEAKAAIKSGASAISTGKNNLWN